MGLLGFVSLITARLFFSGRSRFRAFGCLGFRGLGFGIESLGSKRFGFLLEGLGIWAFGVWQLKFRVYRPWV